MAVLAVLCATRDGTVQYVPLEVDHQDVGTAAAAARGCTDGREPLPVRRVQCAVVLMPADRAAEGAVGRDGLAFGAEWHACVRQTGGHLWRRRGAYPACR